jgi:hypothetical protein
MAVPGNILVQEHIPAADWAKGLYLVRLRSNEQVKVWAKVLKVE